MRKGLLFCAFLTALLFTLASPTISHAQEPEPPLPPRLSQAGYCLVNSTQDWLGLAKKPAQAGQFAWVEDRKSSPGERHMYLLARLDTGAAQLFDIKLETRHGEQVLIIENRLEVVSAKNGANDFASTPAGGPRIERLYKDALLKIHRRAIYDVRLSRLREQVPNLICSSESAE